MSKAWAASGRPVNDNRINPHADGASPVSRESRPEARMVEVWRENSLIGFAKLAFDTH